MAQEINLVPEIAEEEIKKGVYRRKTNVAALVSLFIVVAIILGLFGAQLLLLLLEKKAASDIEQAKNEIKAQLNKDITHRALVEKLTRAQDFLALRNPYSVGFDRLVKLVTDSGVVLKEVKFGENGIVALTADAATSTELSKLISGLEDAGFSKSFAGAQLTSLTGSVGKPYIMTLDFRFVKQEAGANQKKSTNP